MTATYKLTHYAACGMPIPIIEAEDRAELADCRQKAASRLRSLRRDGFPLSLLERGQEWEVREPAGCMLIPDECGILSLKRVPVKTYACFICGDDIPEGEVCSCRECLDCGWDVEACCCHDPQAEE